MYHKLGTGPKTTYYAQIASYRLSSQNTYNTPRNTEYHIYNFVQYSTECNFYRFYFFQDLIYSNSLDDAFNLSKGCHRSNLVINAKKGTAIMWYNHEVDSNSHWLGGIDIYSIHGGCDVIKGEKWAANIWINAPTAQSAHVNSLFG